jgi:hypothetical protein
VSLNSNHTFLQLEKIVSRFSTINVRIRPYKFLVLAGLLGACSFRNPPPPSPTCEAWPVLSTPPVRETRVCSAVDLTLIRLAPIQSTETYVTTALTQGGWSLLRTQESNGSILSEWQNATQAIADVTLSDVRGGTRVSVIVTESP